MRKSERPLQQLVKRIAESETSFSQIPQNENEIAFEKEHFLGPLLKNLTLCKQYSKVRLKNLTLTTKTGNNCVLLSSKSIIVIENLIEKSGEPFMVGRRFEILNNFFPEPFDSTVLDIFECSHLSQLNLWPIKLVAFKMFLIPISGSDTFAAYPIENF